MRSRILLLGASNLSIGLATILRSFHSRMPKPRDIRIAAGFGRSYGRSSRFLSRTLPGILESDLFPDIDSLSQSDRDRPTFALLTDIGNDIGYEVEVPQIIEWVRDCVDRIRSIQSSTRIVMTALPIASLERLSNVHFELAKRTLFPSCTLDHEDVLDRMRRVDAEVREMAHQSGCAIIEVENEWYGLDPIHICRACRAAYWNRVVDAWAIASPDDVGANAKDKLPSWPWLELYLWTRWPKRRRILGTIHQRAQPSGRFSDRSTISVY